MCSGENKVSVQLAALDDLMKSKSSEKEYCSFLTDYRFRVAGRVVDFASVSDLHYALYEEWHLIQAQAPWLLPHRGQRVICCHFKKSTEQRPLLEAECRKNGIEFGPGTTRFGLAALIVPDLPGFCSRHASHMPASRRRKRPASDEQRQLPSIYMRGKMEEDSSMTGWWSIADTNDSWAQAKQDRATFNYRLVEGKVFQGYFTQEEEAVDETNLSFDVDPVTSEIKGHGKNQFGSFRMSGHCRQGSLYLKRDYVPRDDDDAAKKKTAKDTVPQGESKSLNPEQPSADDTAEDSDVGKEPSSTNFLEPTPSNVDPTEPPPISATIAAATRAEAQQKAQVV